MRTIHHCRRVGLRGVKYDSTVDVRDNKVETVRTDERLLAPTTTVLLVSQVTQAGNFDR